MQKFSEIYDIPLIIRILLKNKINKKPIAIIQENKTCNNQICDLITKFSISYIILKLDEINNVEIKNYHAVFLNLHNPEINLIDTLFSKLNNEENSNYCDSNKLILVADKKKIIEYLSIKNSIKCIDYYINHNNSKEYYCCINF